LRRLVVENGARQRVADGVGAIDTIRQDEPARILQDVFGIGQVQCLAVLEERQGLVAHEAGERLAVENPTSWRHGFDGREEARRQIPGAARGPRTAAPGRIVGRGHPGIAPRCPYVRGNRGALTVMVVVQVVDRQDRQVARRREVAHHHVAPRLVVHRELAVPQPVRHRRLDFLSAGGPFDGIARAQIDDAAFPRLVIRQRQLTTDVLRQQAQHRRLRRRRNGRELVQKDDHHVPFRGQALRVPCPGHRQQPHAIRRRDRKAAKVLRLANGADEDDDLALDPRVRESCLEALGELGLADAGKPDHVHRDARLQADRNQLNEVFEVHVSPSLDTESFNSGG
jgi:hypothetical protein